VAFEITKLVGAEFPLFAFSQVQDFKEDFAEALGTMMSWQEA
jgi:hypothetical protein